MKAKEIDNLRKSKGITKTWLAEQIGVTRQHLTNVLRDDNITESLQQKILIALEPNNPEEKVRGLEQHILYLVGQIRKRDEEIFSLKKTIGS